MVSSQGSPGDVPTLSVHPFDANAMSTGFTDPGQQSYLSGLQIGKEVATQPSEIKATVAANDLSAKEKNYLASQSPLAAIAIDKGGQIPKATAILGGHLDAEGNWVESTQDNIVDPATGKGIPFGGVTQTSRPTSTIVTTSPGGPNQEPVATTTYYVVKPGAPKGATAIALDPSTGQYKPTEWGEALPNSTSALISHFQTPQRNNAAVASQEWDKSQALLKQGDVAGSNAHLALFNAYTNGQAEDITKAQAQVDALKANEDIKTAGKDPIALNQLNVQNLQKTFDDLKKNGANTAALAQQQSYIDAAKQHGEQLKAQAAAATGKTVAQGNQAQAVADSAGSAPAARVTSAKIESMEKSFDLISQLAASTKGDEKTGYLKQALALRAKIDAMNDAQVGNPVSGSLQNNPSIPQGAIDMLRANPGTASQFDSTFGKGSSAQYLQQAK